MQEKKDFMACYCVSSIKMYLRAEKNVALKQLMSAAYVAPCCYP
jgi:hypothetical protein